MREYRLDRAALCCLLSGAALLLTSLGVAAKDIVIGQVAAFTGAQSSSGRAIRAGIKLYFDSVNRGGGINGDRIRFITRDDEYKADETVRLVKAMIEEDAPMALIGALGTANIEALVKDGVLTRTGVPLVGAISGASSMLGAANVFVTKASYRDEVDQLFELVARTGTSRVAVVFQNDSLGKDVLTAAQLSAPKQGMTLVAQAPYERNTTQVEGAVAAVMKAEPQLIYLAAVTSAAIEFIKRYRSAGGTAQVYGLSVIDVATLLRTLGPDMARGFAFGALQPLTAARKYAIVREYQQLRATSEDKDLAERSLEGFIAAKALVHALRLSRAVNAQAVLRALSGMRGVDLGDYYIDFTRPDRTGSRFVEFAIIGRAGKIEH